MLKNQKIAWGFSLVLIVFSVFIFGGNEIKKIADESKLIFETGTYEDMTSIDKELNKIVSNGNNLIVVSKRVMPDEKIVKTFEDNVNNLKEAKTPKKKYEEYVKLIESLDKLNDEADNKEKSEKDGDYFELLTAEIKASKRKIENNNYNYIAEKTNEEISGFPQTLIRTVRRIRLVEIFG